MRLLSSYTQYRRCISDLIDAPVVRSMGDYIQHSMVSTLEHCLFVSFMSFIICRFFKLNYYSAARGGLLHDLFLYDWHDIEHRGKLHGLTHPTKALENANVYFKLSKMEQDIIVKHMWPITIKFPRYRESFVVSLADKFCACAEVMGMAKLKWIDRIMKADVIHE